MSDVIVRNAGKEDLSRIASIEELCFSKPWTEASIEKDMEGRFIEVFVAEQDGVVAGYCIAEIIPGADGELNRIGTDPAFRRRGIGRLLMNELVSRCKELGADRILLDVRESNSAAIALYRSFGFETDGIRKKYYDGKEDAILMSRAANMEYYEKQQDNHNGN